MDALLMISFLGIALYGYLLICRFDRFLKQGGFAEEPEAFTEKEILLYGGGEAADDLSRALDNAAIAYDRTAEPEIKDGAVYRWVGAFSEDDENNLLMCLAAKRKSGGIRTMAKCNDRIYENLFRQTGVTVILQNEVPASRVLACLKR